MSILDDIAHPQIPNYLQGLQTVSNIESQRVQRQAAEVQAGIALQNMLQQRQKMAGQAQGRNVIQQFLGTPQPNKPIQARTPVAQPQATQATQMPQAAQAVQMPQATQAAPTQQTGPANAVMPQGNAPAPTPAAAPTATPAPIPTEGGANAQPLSSNAVKQIVQPFQNAPADLFAQADNLQNLADRLAAIPGNEQQAKLYYDLANKSYDHAVNQSKDQRNQSQLIYELAGNNFYKIAKLEDSGNTGQAKALYDQTRDLILNDPRFSRDQEIQNVFQQFKNYQPGLGTFIYASTMYGQKAREQFIREHAQHGGAATTFTMDTSDGYRGVFSKADGSFIDYARDAKGEPLKAFKAKKEENIGERFAERLGISQEKLSLDKQKQNFKSTDDIIRFKNQETKDLRTSKDALERALSLADTKENLPLIDKLLKQGLSKWENTSVRAYAELQQFANVGDLEQRVAGYFSQKLFGKMIPEQRTMIKDTARLLLDKYVNPGLNIQTQYWRRLASERNLDPDQIAPYQTKEEVAQDLKAGTIKTREQAIKILSKPRFKWQTQTQ